MSNSAPRRNERALTIAVTPGEPAGIGPDLALMLGSEDWPVRLVFLCDPTLLAERAAQLGLSAGFHDFTASSTTHRRGHYTFAPVPLAAPVTPGRLDPANASYVLACLDRALEGLHSGEFDALVTGPVHKANINAAGVPFTGHTEYLAAAAGETPVMMLAAPDLRVALVTTHLPLAAVPACITQEAVEFTVRVVWESLRERFGLAAPRLGVCGLNPHAGESGHLGREEIERIEPALNRCRAAGMDVRGPLPADTAFTPEMLPGFDAIIAMYHDQGLTALKALGFGNAVNVTLGLPFIRTSVDHGTALDLAGSGRIHVGSLQAATRMAIELASHQRQTRGQP